MFEGLLNHLARVQGEAQTVFAFELKVLEELGLSPMTAGQERSDNDSGASRPRSDAVGKDHLHRDPIEADAGRPRPGVSPGAMKAIATLAATDWASIERLKLSPQQTKEIRQWLHGFLIYHLGKYPESRTKALEGIF